MTFDVNAHGNPAEYTGHGVNTGGLQSHSIGDTYPFMVVGTMHRTQDVKTDHTRYYVLNCATGDKYYWQCPASGKVMTWADIGSAEMTAQHLKDGHQGPLIHRIKN